MGLNKVLCVVGERIHRGLEGVELGFQCEDVLEEGAAMFAHITERQIAAIHPQDDERARDAQNGRSFCWAEFLVFGQNCNALAAQHVGQKGFNRGSSRGWNRELLFTTALMMDVKLEPVA